MNAPVLQIVPERNALVRLLAGHSLEITARETGDLAGAAPLLVPGTRLSVTFLPKESVDKRLAAVAETKRLGLAPVAHVAARRMRSADELDSYLGALADMGAVEELFIIAGDPDTPDGPYEDALAVIRSGLLQRHGVKRVGIGGYPEAHPKISDAKLWQALLDKNTALAEAGIEAAILTQFGFRTEPVFDWLNRVRDAGVTAPIRLGVPGPASAATLMRFAARCGVAASRGVLSKYGLSLTKLMQPTGPDKYVRALAQGLRSDRLGDVGLHFYPFGGLVETAAWIRAFSAMQGD